LLLRADGEIAMVHIREARVSGNHAAAGRWTPAASDTPFLTVKGILLAVMRRAARRKEMAAAQSTWIPKARQSSAGQPTQKVSID
jgi:hypothetical protein